MSAAVQPDIFGGKALHISGGKVGNIKKSFIVSLGFVKV